jgi:hypothetical protein
MPVFRNPQYYFREGFCWTNVLNPQARLLKVKLKGMSVNDVGSMSLFSKIDSVPNYYIVTLLNSEILFDYYREFINCTVNIQINDIRQMPIIIPNKDQLTNCNNIFQDIILIKKKIFANVILESYFEKSLSEMEQNSHNFVKKLYDFV